MDFFENVISLSQYEPTCSANECIAEELRDIFSKINLPTPHDGEYAHGVGNIGLVFLQQTGCVLRVVSEKSYALRRHPHIMRPIGSIRLSNAHRLDCQYTGQSPITKMDLDKVEYNFFKDGLIVKDSYAQNFCYSNYKNASFPTGVPVIFDPNGVNLMLLSLNARKIRNLSGRSGLFRSFVTKLTNAQQSSRILDLSPQDGEEPDGQDFAYVDLRDKFTAMFDVENSVSSIVVDPVAVQDFGKP